ncbi:RHS repeat-associated core domain-containing protein [Amycolatopsis decaplanina]|uniref:RHS repeat-containing protein n=1 Tax=Amycolatopsis decaplanina DSM 44594 TaxID=1284240 RepID=M2XGM9_9PSEU|nr:RHS repeat-associated core domain-containing protein [Amycolatopsis decaplanina]EME60116.1 RHS repeat-containing protein [Amycolatopsis decaplanina DSM 44594]
MGNPLVAEVKDSTKAYTGSSLLESAFDLKSAIESGDWASVALGAVGTALDALSMAMDPFGAILANGVGWLMEHVGPLKEALDALTGNADEINANSETWKNIATELGEVGADLAGMVSADLQSWTGVSADAYRAQAKDTVTLLESAKAGCEGASSGVKTAGEVVAAVRALVRDIIAELIGHLISWALQVLFTLGIGLTWVVPQVVNAVAKTASKIANLTKKTVKALQALMPLLKRADDLFDSAAKALKKLQPGKGAPAPKPNKLDEGTTPKSSPDGGETTPSGAPPAKNDPPPVKSDPPPPPKNETPDGPTTPSGSPPPPPPRDRGAPKPETNNRIKDNETTPGDRVPPKDRGGCGDPIDVATGSMMLTQDDVVFAGVLPLTVSRTHLSSYRLGRFFGSSWASTLDQRIEIEDDGLHLALADGTLLSYPVPLSGRPVLPDFGQRLPLSKVDDGYVVSTPDGMLFFSGPGDTLPLRAIAEGDGHRIFVHYDDNGVPRELEHSAGYRLLIESKDGLVTALRLPGAEAALQSYRYDERRRLVEIVDAAGQPLRFTYDAEGRIVRWEDVNGRWYGYGFDSEGRVVRAQGTGGFLDVDIEYDRENLVTSVTNSLGHVTRYQLDELHRIVAETDPLGNTTRYEIDRFGKLLSRTDALGRTTRWETDDDGNVVTVIQPDGGRALAEYSSPDRWTSMTGPDGAIWRREYDERGKLVRATDPTGATTTYGYDDAGNVAVVTDALGGVTRIESNAAGLPVAVTDPLGGTTRYTYDEFGQTTSVTDPLGGVTRTKWDGFGEIAEQIDPDGSVWRWNRTTAGYTDEAVDARGLAVRTEYSQFDLPTAEIGPDGDRLSYVYDTELRLTSVTNEHGLSWRYDHDPAGNLVSETDFNGRTTRYGYDAAGQLVSRTNGLGQTVTIERDALGRVVGRRAGDDVATFTYDGADRMISARNAHSEVTIAYDALGRIVAESLNGRAVRSEYDAIGRRVARRTPSGAESFFAYDAASRPVSLRTAGRTLRFEYDPSGREVLRRLDGTPIELRQGWDAADRLTSQTVSSGRGVVQHREYGYLRDGLVSSISDLLSGPRSLRVDRAGRVVDIQGQGWRESYGYNLAGAITQAGWPGSDPAVGPRHYQGTLMTGAGSTSYLHDTEGRTIARRKLGGDWTYQWNSDDRLTGVVTPDGERWLYHYDALGRRIAKQHLDAQGRILEQIDFTWDGSNLAEEIRGGTAVVWDLEPGTERPVTQIERTQGHEARFLAVVTDLVGSPSELLDESGNVAWHLHTSLWGKVLSPPGQAYTPLRFPGQYHDPETGLHYNFKRYYDPDTGRYLSHDPLGLEPASDSLAYVGNPTDMIDPLGLAPTKPKKGTCSKGAGRTGGGKTKSSGNRVTKPKPAPGPKKPRRPPQSYLDGTHGAKTREQNRLTAKYDNDLKTDGREKVSGASHESEHPIPYEAIGRGSGGARGSSHDQKDLENHAWAYQEAKPAHKSHIGTGNKGDQDLTEGSNNPSAFKNSQSYRDSERNALEIGDPNTAIQLNQLDYAFRDGFKNTNNTLDGKIADDSYHKMIDDAHASGKGLTYSTGPGTTATTPPLSSHDVKELHMTRDTIRTGEWPEEMKRQNRETYEEEVARIHEETYKKPTKADWEKLEAGGFGPLDTGKKDPNAMDVD